jgi:hypothetical protein
MGVHGPSPLTQKELIRTQRIANSSFDWQTGLSARPLSVVVFNPDESYEILDFDRYVASEQTLEGQRAARERYFSGRDMVLASRQIANIAYEILKKRNYTRAKSLEGAMPWYQDQCRARKELAGLLLPQITIAVKYQNPQLVEQSQVMDVLAARVAQLPLVEQQFFKEAHTEAAEHIEYNENLVIKYLLNEFSEHNLFKSAQGEEFLSEYLLALPYDPCASGETRVTVGYKLAEGLVLLPNIVCDLYVKPEKDYGDHKSCTFSLVWTNSSRGKPLEFAELSFRGIKHNESSAEGPSKKGHCVNKFTASGYIALAWSFKLSKEDESTLKQKVSFGFTQIVLELLQKQDAPAEVVLSFCVSEPSPEGMTLTPLKEFTMHRNCTTSEGTFFETNEATGVFRPALNLGENEPKTWEEQISAHKILPESLDL